MSARLGAPSEARWLLEDVAGRPLARLLGAGGAPAEAQAAAIERLVERRLAGEPLQHLLHRWSFRRLELVVDRRALVPRPETEVVVGYALGALAAVAAGPVLRAVDLGTGSGAIACSLVREDPAVSVVAVDVDPAALALAAENRALLDPGAAGRLELRQGSWYEPLADLAGEVAVVVANPPYLAEDEWPELDPVVRDFDPYGALVAGPTGLEAVEAVLSGAPSVLCPGGTVVVELAPAQAGAAVTVARRHGARSAHVRPDLAGRPRCLVATW